MNISKRFRGYLPVIVDVETSGLNAATDALLEISAVMVTVNEEGLWCIDKTISKYVEPFAGANFDKASLEFTGINPEHPFRKQIAVSEKTALSETFEAISKMVKKHNCNRAILVGHNASFDLGFLNAAIERTKIKKSPFHLFSTFDTVTLAGLVYGQTVLSRAAKAAGIEWNEKEAHSARYDAEQTALLFCDIVNKCGFCRDI